jgi:hypothetical protein
VHAIRRTIRSGPVVRSPRTAVGSGTGSPLAE